MEYNPVARHGNGNKGQRLLDRALAGHNMSLVRDLQIIHDTVKTLLWEKEFLTLATKHRLVYKEPEVVQDL